MNPSDKGLPINLFLTIIEGSNFKGERVMISSHKNTFVFHDTLLV